jgi:cation/acetate symporter
MLVNFIVAFAVSKVTKEVPAEVQNIVESIRFPKGAGAASSH